MRELADKYEKEAGEEAELHRVGEQANSYHGQGKRLLFTDVRYKSKGTLMGGSKDRIGTLQMEHGIIEARRFEGGQSILVYQFRIESSVLGNSNPSSASIEIASPQDKTRAFTFKNPAECNQFVEAFNATKNWISG